jgi:hypothetical protein
MLILLFSVLQMIAMNNIEQAADGLLFMSESDHPLVYFELDKAAGVEQKLRTMSEHKDGQIEVQELEYFFRNMTKEREGEDHSVAKRFQQLEKILKQELKNIKVYRVGEIQVDAFILGERPDGSITGLRTKLIET